MITLYGMTSPNVVKIFIALEELGLDYELKPVDVFDGKHFTAEFAKLNPNGKVPVIVDSDGPGGKPYTVFESGAILLYLAEKTGRLLPKDTAAKYAVIQWMMVQMTGMGPMFGQYVHFWRFAREGNDYAYSRYRTQALRVCEALEARLATVPYLGGADYSIADVATYPWARNIDAFFGDQKQAFPNLHAWVNKLSERPAVAKAVKITEDLRAKLTSFDKASPELLDQIFGRGKFAV